MLGFAVFDQGGPAAEWPLDYAFLVGPDDVPVQAEIRFASGVIRCEKRSADAAGLAVQFPVDAPAESEGASGGLLLLQTCLLPEREAPYLLSLELARHRLMLIINKLEDWAMFELAPDEPALLLFERARQAFTGAVAGAGGGPPGARPYTLEADRLARHALGLAVQASEALALARARVMYQRRFSGELALLAEKIRPPENALTEYETRETRNTIIGSVGVILPGAPLIGCVVSPEQGGPGLQATVQSSCDFITMPMRWVDMEPTEGRYTFTPTDRWIEWAVRSAKVPVVAGPVVDFRPRCVPEWMYIWEHDYETLRDLVTEYIKNIVTRYRRTVRTWTVCSGLNVNGNFSLTLEQVMDLTRVCVLVVRKLQPGAVVQVEIDQPWGDYHGSNPRSIPPMLYAEMLVSAGIGVDVLALRVQMGVGEEKTGHGYGRPTRDLMALSALLDKYAILEKPIAVTALGAPSTPAPGPGGPGYWRRPWSAEAQADWLGATVALCASKPYLKSVCWQELCDTAREPGCEGLVGAGGDTKPAVRRLAEVRQALREKRTPV